MKRFFLLLLAGPLSGCLVITPEPVIPPVTPISVLEATYRTDVSVNGQPAICDNRTTTLSYTFRYQGELESWTSFLKGVKLGEEKGMRTFTPNVSGVSPYEENGYEVTYTLGANAAPYAASEKGQGSKAIVVVPVPQPQIIGASKLHLILTGADGNAEPYISPEIPVVINCP